MELDGSSIPTMPFSEKDMGIWTQRSSYENEAETEVTLKSPKLMDNDPKTVILDF